MTYETIRLETDGAVAWLTLDRPAVLNAINRAMIREIHAALDHVEADDGVRVLVVQGAGRAFSAGFDLKESAADPIQGVAAWREVLKRDLDMTMRFWRLAKPTIAAVHGYCLAGACELAVACDITIAAADAVFGEPELRFGSGIVTQILPWVVGPKRAKEILLTGNDRLSAAEAHATGLVNRVVARENLTAEALRMARTIAVMDGGAVRLTKEAINRAWDIMGLAQALEAGVDLAVQVETLDTPERREFDAIRRRDGLKAALAWRDARFAGPPTPAAPASAGRARRGARRRAG